MGFGETPLRSRGRLIGKTVVLPRYLRLRDAPNYLGMCRAEFNTTVRPYLTHITIGRQGIAFDRFELDAWADYHKDASGRPPERRTLWLNDERQDSVSAEQSGTLTNGSTAK